MGIHAQTLLVGLNGLAKHLVTLADYAHIVVSLRLTQWVGLSLGCLLELGHSGRVLVLEQQRISQVIGCLRIAVVLFYGLAVADLGIGKVTSPVLLVTLTDILAVGLGTHAHGHQQQQNGCSGLFAGTKQRHTLQQRVLALKQANLNNEQQQSQDAKRLELLVIVAVDSCLRLLLGQLLKFLVEQVLSIAVVLDVDIGTATG